MQTEIRDLGGTIFLRNCTVNSEYFTLFSIQKFLHIATFMDLVLISFLLPSPH